MAKVAVIQLVSGKDWQYNLERCAYWLGEAADRGAELVLLPENFAVFNTGQLVERGAQELSYEGPIRQFLSQQARQHRLWIVAGSLPILADDGKRVRSACLVVDDQGQERARYDKIHLFDVEVADKQGSYRESDQIEPGDKPVVVDTPVGLLGLSICYDLRFAELYRHLVEAGAELISVPAAFTKITGEAHWQVLLRARAIETQSFVLAANQGGVHDGKRETYGHSMIIDPWGTVLGSHAEGEGVVVVDIDPRQLTDRRQQMPIQQHRRL